MTMRVDGAVYHPESSAWFIAGEGLDAKGRGTGRSLCIVVSPELWEPSGVLIGTRSNQATVTYTPNPANPDGDPSVTERRQA